MDVYRARKKAEAKAARATGTQQSAAVNVTSRADRGGAGAGVLGATKRALGLRPAPEKTAAEKLKDELGECCMCPSLSISQRFTGTLVCLGVTALWFTLAIVTLSTGQLSLFGIYYTCGNVSAVSSTMFMVGPCRQLRLMMKPTRICSVIVFLGFMVMTLLAAFEGLTGWVPCLVFACCQFLAAIYYALSYVPFGQKGARFLFSRATGLSRP